MSRQPAVTCAVDVLPPADRDITLLRRFQLQVQHRLDGLLHGDYLGLLPGPGSEAGESQEYRPGDDVRRMDWPVTARTTVPHVRLTEADRELETWLAVDLSASLNFGTAQLTKRELALAAAVAVAGLTMRGGNRIGAVACPGNGAVRRFPARPGAGQAHGMLRAVAGTEARQEPGGVPCGLGHLIATVDRPPRRRGLVVVISDFLVPPADWARPLRRLAVRHHVLAVEVVDPRELALPDVGVLELLDPETGHRHEVQTADPRLRVQYAAAAARQRDEIAAAIRTAGARQLRLRTDSDWLLDVARFVRQQRRIGNAGRAGPGR